MGEEPPTVVYECVGREGSIIVRPCRRRECLWLVVSTLTAGNGEAGRLKPRQQIQASSALAGREGTDMSAMETNSAQASPVRLRRGSVGRFREGRRMSVNCHCQAGDGGGVGRGGLSVEGELCSCHSPCEM
jgi:hypothetical protein